MQPSLRTAEAYIRVIIDGNTADGSRIELRELVGLQGDLSSAEAAT